MLEVHLEQRHKALKMTYYVVKMFFRHPPLMAVFRNPSPHDFERADLKQRPIVQLFDILIVKLQIHRRHVQTRMPKHLLQPPYIPSVAHTVNRI